MNLVIWMSVIGLITAAVYMLSKWISRLLGVEGVDLEETKGGKVFKWGCGILLGIYFVIIINLGIVNEQEVPGSYILLVIAALWLYKALLEWKYIKGSKQYIRTLIELIILMTAIPLAHKIIPHFPVF